MQTEKIVALSRKTEVVEVEESRQKMALKKRRLFSSGGGLVGRSLRSWKSYLDEESIVVALIECEKLR